MPERHRVSGNALVSRPSARLGAPFCTRCRYARESRDPGATRRDVAPGSRVSLRSPGTRERSSAEGESEGDTPALRLRLALLHAVLVLLVLLVLDRHRIDPAEPAVEVDIGATPRAERAELRHRRLAADRARLTARRLAARGLGALGHAAHMETRARPANITPS